MSNFPNSKLTRKEREFLLEMATYCATLMGFTTARADGLLPKGIAFLDKAKEVFGERTEDNE